MGRRWAIAVPFLLASTDGAGAFDPPDKMSPPLEEIARRAEEGDAIAQTYLGLVYDLAAGLPLDADAAARWYRLAAEQGNADSQFFLGTASALGRGVLRTT
jgi:TPR repeat protein